MVNLIDFFSAITLKSYFEASTSDVLHTFGFDNVFLYFIFVAAFVVACSSSKNYVFIKYSDIFIG